MKDNKNEKDGFMFEKNIWYWTLQSVIYDINSSKDHMFNNINVCM